MSRCTDHLLLTELTGASSKVPQGSDVNDRHMGNIQISSSVCQRVV